MKKFNVPIPIPRIVSGVEQYTVDDNHVLLYVNSRGNLVLTDSDGNTWLVSEYNMDVAYLEKNTQTLKDSGSGTIPLAMSDDVIGVVLRYTALRGEVACMGVVSVFSGSGDIEYSPGKGDLGVEFKRSIVDGVLGLDWKDTACNGSDITIFYEAVYFKK